TLPKLGNGNTSHILRVTKLQCIEAPYKLSHLNYCHMVQLSNGTVGLNTSVDIPIVLNYFEVTAKVYYKYTTYRPFMIDWTIELCQADRIGKFNPSTALVMKIMEQSVPEFYYPCPHGCIEAPYEHTHLNYCQMVQLQNGTVGLNVSVTMPNVLNYVEITAKLFYKYTTYRPFMIDWNIEFCQTYRTGKFNPSGALVLKIVEETLPNYYYSCPHGLHICVLVSQYSMGRMMSRTVSLLLCCVLTQVFIAILSHGAKQLNKKIAIGNINRTVRVNKMLCINTPYKHTFLKHCEMEQFANGTVGLHISVHIPIVLNYVEVIAKSYYKYTTYQPFLIDWNMEYCQAARVGKFNPSHALVMKIIEETLPDFYYPCPHGNRTYTVFWLLPARLLPQSLPSGNYRLDIFYRDS
uniref:Uncharacterized protein n=1 Tax=Anopheles minimus TaxID=112268 RepID=A0A182W2H9_9DIPT